jgi:hypothetical protein
LAETAKKFFFEAMRHGWASGEAKFVATEFRGWKEKTWFYKNPDFPNFVLVDKYETVSDSRVSHGRKSISYLDVPIWFMDYGGWYDKEVIPFLKEALMLAYSSEVFCGGRGRASFTRNEAYPGMLYINQGEFLNFAGFRGRELATDPFGKPRGEHNYFGGLMI